MKDTVRRWLVACGIVSTVVPAGAQAPVGALAVDERQGDQFGWAVNYSTTEAAHEAALRECGLGCSVVLTFERCAAYAADQVTNSTATGWSESLETGAAARQRALQECRSRGGSGCIVRAWGCNGGDPQTVETALNLDRSTRRLIQQGLRVEGFDPGGVDGLFGPRTRAAIRDWQAAQGMRMTGHLDGPSAERLRLAGAPRQAAAEVQTPESSPTPSVRPARPPASSAPAPAQPSVSAQQENLFWQSIMDTTNPVEFEAYLAQFPNGVFRALAQARLAALRAPASDPPADDEPRLRPMVEAAVDEPLRLRRPSIDFGDDAGDYAQDGECDDPRFEGPGMGVALDSHLAHDATDCRELFESGRVSLRGAGSDSPATRESPTVGQAASRARGRGQGPECTRERLIGLGVLDSSISASTIQFTVSRMVVIQSSGAASTRQESENTVSANTITYRIVRATGTAPGSGSSAIPIINAGPHTVPCSLSGRVLSFGDGTWH